MNDDIRVGVLLPTGHAFWDGGDARRIIDFAVEAERLGYGSLWVNDSLLSPRIEALTMLAAVAPVTTRVTLGTAALLPVLRRPVQAAQVLASLDLLSGGRLVVAVGAAFPGRFGRPVHALSEVPWEGRFGRLDETVALWRRLWSAGGPSDFHGTVLNFDDIPAATPAYRKEGPPIWYGGASGAALERTGRLYDGWLPYPPDPEDYRTGLGEVRRAAAGRTDVTPALFVSVLVAETEEIGRRALQVYSRNNYGMPLEELETVQAVVTGPPERVVERLGAYVEAGARHLVCRLGAVDLASQREQLGRLAEIVPLIGR